MKDKMDMERAKEVVKRVRAQTGKWLFGLEKQAEILSWAVFTLLPYTDKLTCTKKLHQPHVMFRGPTGTGKTDLVTVFAMTIDAKFERVQGSPELKPSDILGYETIVEGLDGNRSIRFLPGPIAAHMLLIDEDNRLTPKTKSAILEGMEESSATLKSA